MEPKRKLKTELQAPKITLTQLHIQNLPFPPPNFPYINQKLAVQSSQRKPFYSERQGSPHKSWWGEEWLLIKRDTSTSSDIELLMVDINNWVDQGREKWKELMSWVVFFSYFFVLLSKRVLDGMCVGVGFDEKRSDNK